MIRATGKGGLAMGTAASNGLAELLRGIDRPIVLLAQGVDPFDRGPREGYRQRVSTMDARLAGRPRIYLTTPRPRGAPMLRRLGPQCYEIAMNGEADVEGQEMARAVIGNARAIYCHSIYPLQAGFLRRMVAKRACPLLLDLHGIVPEEAKVQGAPEVERLESLEEWAMLAADILVHVTRQMQQHFARKYAWAGGKHIVCPIFSSARAEATRPRRNRIVYAGGAQQWQLVDRMVALAAAGLRTYDFAFLSPEANVFEARLAQKGVAPDGDRLIVRAARPAEVMDMYIQSRFGLLCRDDSLVNRVACPTKLIEYLTSGLVPLLSNPQIGDFPELGMRHWPVQAILDGAPPPDHELDRIIAHNQAATTALGELSATGVTEILAALDA